MIVYISIPLNEQKNTHSDDFLFFYQEKRRDCNLIGISIRCIAR